MYPQDVRNSIWKIGMSVRHLLERSLRRSGAWACEIIDAKIKFLSHSVIEPPGDVAKSINYSWSVLETPTSFKEVESPHARVRIITEIRDNEPRKDRGGVMIIMLDRYVKIIDSSEYSKLHLYPYKDGTRYSWFLISREEAQSEGFIYIYIGIFVFCIYIK